MIWNVLSSLAGVLLGAYVVNRLERYFHPKEATVLDFLMEMARNRKSR